MYFIVTSKGRPVSEAGTLEWARFNADLTAELRGGWAMVLDAAGHKVHDVRPMSPVQRVWKVGQAVALAAGGFVALAAPVCAFGGV